VICRKYLSKARQNPQSEHWLDIATNSTLAILRAKTSAFKITVTFYVTVIVQSAVYHKIHWSVLKTK
jgi:hypothetical protein